MQCKDIKTVKKSEQQYICTFKLPNNQLINSTSRDSVEFYLVNWIKDTTKIVNRTTWFNFDKLLFDQAQAKLDKNSENQLQNIASIMNAFPKLEVKIGSYTDSLEVAHDQKMNLSQQRAQNTANDLIALGINKNKLQFEGYNDQYPVASNKTKEGRAENRRIAIRITKK